MCSEAEPQRRTHSRIARVCCQGCNRSIHASISSTYCSESSKQQQQQQQRCGCKTCLYVSIAMRSHHGQSSCIASVNCTFFSPSPVPRASHAIILIVSLVLLCFLSHTQSLGGFLGSEFVLLAESASLEDAHLSVPEPLVDSVVLGSIPQSSTMPFRSTLPPDGDHGKGPHMRMCGALSCVGVGMIVLFGGLTVIAVLIVLYCFCVRKGKTLCDDDCSMFCLQRSRPVSIIVIPSAPIDPSQFSDSSIGKQSHYSDNPRQDAFAADDDYDGNEHVKQISSAVFRESITSKQFRGENGTVSNGPSTTPNFHAFAPRNAPKKVPDVSIMSSLSALLLTQDEKDGPTTANQKEKNAQPYEPPPVPQDSAPIKTRSLSTSRSPSQKSSAELKSAVLLSARATSATAANDATAFNSGRKASQVPVVREISADETESMNPAAFSLDTDDEENDSSSSDSQSTEKEPLPQPNNKPCRLRGSISTPGSNGLINGAGSTQGNTARSDDNSSSDDSDTLEYLTNYSARKPSQAAPRTPPLGQSRSCPYLPLPPSTEFNKTENQAAKKQLPSTALTRSSSTDTSSSVSTNEAEEIALEASIRNARQRSSTTAEVRGGHHAPSSRRDNSSRQPLQPLYNGLPKPIPVNGRTQHANSVHDENAETHPAGNYARLLPEEYLRNVPQPILPLSGHTREERSNTVIANGGYAGNIGPGHTAMHRAHSAPGRDEVLYIPVGPKGEGRFEISQEERDSLVRSRKWLVFHDVDGMDGLGDAM